MRMKAVLKLAIFGGLLLFGGVALAQSGGDRVSYKKRTVIDLSGAVIEGELTKPEGSYIVNRKLSRFSTLIQVRMHFLTELEDSANEL